MWVPPSLWPQLAQLLTVGAPVRRIGEEWLLERLSTRAAWGSDDSSTDRRSGARGAHSQGNQHHLWGVLRRRMHSLPAQEVCQRGDGSGDEGVRPDPQARPRLHQGRPVRRGLTRQWPSDDLGGDSGKKGTPCPRRPRKLGQCDVLVDLQQATIVPRPIEALRWLLIWFRWRPSRGVWTRRAKHNLH